MNGNFDYNTNINSDNADLTPFWEVAEKEYRLGEISWALHCWDDAINAPDWAWEAHFDTLHGIVRDMEDYLLSEFGLTPNQAIYAIHYEW